MVSGANQPFSSARDLRLWGKRVLCETSFPEHPSGQYHIWEKGDSVLYLLRIINMFFLVQKAIYLLLSSLIFWFKLC